MKFPRNTRLQRSPFDIAPFAAVFFLLVIFVMLAVFLPVPGIPLQLPELPAADNSPGKDLPGTDKPPVAVAIDSNGRLYFENQIVNEAGLNLALKSAAKNSREPLTLVIHADKSVTYGQLVRLMMLARDAGIRDVLLATLPRVISAPDQP
jgi:biopolymer transport protein ExbD